MALLPVTQRAVVDSRGRHQMLGVADPAVRKSSLSAGAQRRLTQPLHAGDQPYPMVWGPPVKYVRIPRGEDGTLATLKVMKKLVLSPWGHRNPEVVLLAKKIVRKVSPGPTKDYRAMAAAILEFMKGNVSRKFKGAGTDYQLDPAGLEWVQTPWYTLLVEGSGDCDDHSTATGALAMALGMSAGFRTVKGDAGRPEQWSHVYPVIGFMERGKLVWVTADSTQKESFLGWDPPEKKLFGMKTWEIDPSIAEGPEWDN